MKPVLKVFILFLLFSSESIAQTLKIKINGPGQLNNRIYSFHAKISQVFYDNESFYSVLYQVRDSLLHDFDKYDLSSNRGVLNIYNNTLARIALYERKPDSATIYLDRYRKIYNNRVTTDLVVRAITVCQEKALEDKKGDTFKINKEKFAANLSNLIASYSLDEFRTNLLTDRQYWILNGPSWQLSNLPLVLKKYGDSTKLSQSLLLELISKRFTRDFLLSLEDIIPTTFTKSLKVYNASLFDIWTPRTVSLGKTKNLHPVTIAVIELPNIDIGYEWTHFKEFRNKFYINTKEIPGNGIDDDGNGWIDDVYGIPFNSKTYTTYDTVPPVKLTLKEMEEARLFDKGQTDIYNIKNTPETVWLIKWTKNHSQDEYWNMFDRVLNYKDCGHLTAVSAITVAGNPAIRLMVNTDILYNLFSNDLASFDSSSLVNRMEAWRKQFTEMVSYFKEHHVKAVNMSWGAFRSDFENALQKQMPGLKVEERNGLSAKIFDIYKTTLSNAIESAPDILFVCGTGNQAIDISKKERIPQTLNFPNLIVTSMVDAEGKYSFGNYGKVDVYAYGANRDVLMPDGKYINWSGSSLAVPEIVNLAGKLLAICPELSIPELRNVILNGSDEVAIGPDGKTKLLNPKKSVELLKAQCKPQGLK